MKRCVAWAVALSSLGIPLDAQWINHPSPGIPRTPDGKPALDAPAPKTADGRVDLSGIWQNVRSTRPQGVLPGSSDLSRYLADGSAIEMLPAAAETSRKIVAAGGLGLPSETCLPKSLPNALILPSPIQIVQTPGFTLMLLEEFNNFRQVFTDSRPHPADMNPSWFGYSVGRWEAGAFVVDTRGFRDGLWLDASGHVATDRLRTIERWERRDVGHLRVQLTIDDPGAFKRPWTAEVQFNLLPDTNLMEFVCENERFASKRK